MELIICENYEEMSRTAAGIAAETLLRKPDALLSFAGGETPLGFVHRFADMVNSGQIDPSRAYYVSLDEWAGLSWEDEGSCGLFNQKELLGRMRTPFLQAHVINGAADMQEECRALDGFIAAHGPLTLSVLGIGMNGHLGFNEEGVPFDLNAHVIPLSETTKRVMPKYFGEKFHPEYGISQGIRQIMAAETVLLLASGAHKADILREALRGDVTNQVPASILQTHPNCVVVADKAAAAML